MSLTRRRFTQILASTLFLHHLPSFAQSVKFWASLTLPEAQHITRIVSAGAPADLLLLAVAPEKMVGFSSFDFARQALIPLPEHIRQFPRLGRLAGRASTLSLEGLMALHPDLVVDCGNTDETWISQARQVSEQTQIPWLLLNGKLQERLKATEQLEKLGILHLATRRWNTLSGGERQLALIARALVQQPRLLLLDEPASSLDFGHQIQLLDTLAQLKNNGMTMLMSTHHPLHANAIADSIIQVEPDGRVTQGLPTEQLTTKKLAALYRVSADQIHHHLSAIKH
ncbi:ATP-binding cassette domain-containing protein [Escherichia coli]